METIKFSLIGKEDLKLGTSTFEVTLADGRTVVLNDIDISNLFRVNYVHPLAPIVAFLPGLSYAEIVSPLRQQIDFSRKQSMLMRVLAHGWGTETGNAKGIAITDASGNVLAEVAWDGDSEAERLGQWTSTIIVVDTLTQLRAKGSSATESLVLNKVVLECYKILK